MPAALAALGSHEILKLGNLFVEAIDVLVKEPTEKQYQPRSPQPASPTWTSMAERTEWELLAVTSQTKRACWDFQALQFAQVQSLQRRNKETTYGLIHL